MSSVEDTARDPRALAGGEEPARAPWWPESQVCPGKASTQEGRPGRGRDLCLPEGRLTGAPPNRRGHRQGELPVGWPQLPPFPGWIHHVLQTRWPGECLHFMARDAGRAERRGPGAADPWPPASSGRGYVQGGTAKGLWDPLTRQPGPSAQACLRDSCASQINSGASAAGWGAGEEEGRPGSDENGNPTGAAPPRPSA